MKLINQALLAVSALALGACASVKVDKEKAQGVKKVAIIGFDVEQQRPVSTSDLIGVALKTKSTDPHAEIKLRSESSHVVKMYDDLRQKLETSNKWKVLSMDQVKASSAYQAHFKDKTEGFQNRPMVNERYDVMSPPGILDSFAIYTTKGETLSKLQKDLGVDALAVVKITVNLNNDSALASMVGQGTFSPSASTALQLIDGRSNDKIWSESAAVGEKQSNGDKNFMGMADQEKINQLAVRAANSSYAKLIAQYNEQLKK